MENETNKAQWGRKIFRVAAHPFGVLGEVLIILASDPFWDLAQSKVTLTMAWDTYMIALGSVLGNPIVRVAMLALGLIAIGQAARSIIKADDKRALQAKERADTAAIIEEERDRKIVSVIDDRVKLTRLIGIHRLQVTKIDVIQGVTSRATENFHHYTSRLDGLKSGNFDGQRLNMVVEPVSSAKQMFKRAVQGLAVFPDLLTNLNARYIINYNDEQPVLCEGTGLSGAPSMNAFRASGNGLWLIAQDYNAQQMERLLGHLAEMQKEEIGKLGLRAAEIDRELEIFSNG